MFIISWSDLCIGLIIGFAIGSILMFFTADQWIHFLAEDLKKAYRELGEINILYSNKCRELNKND